MTDFAAFPSVCQALLERPAFATPRHVLFNETTGVLELELPGLTLELDHLVGNPEWLIAAQHLGGLHVRVLPHTEPVRLTLFAEWEGQVVTLSGIPVAR